MFSFNYEVFNFSQLNIILYILNVFLNSGPLNTIRSFIESNFQNKQLLKTVSTSPTNFLPIKFCRKIE